MKVELKAKFVVVIPFEFFVGIVGIGAGRESTELNDACVVVDLNDAEPVFAKIDSILVVGHHLEHRQSGIVLGDLAGVADHVAAKHKKHVRIRLNQPFENGFAYFALLSHLIHVVVRGNDRRLVGLPNQLPGPFPVWLGRPPRHIEMQILTVAGSEELVMAIAAGRVTAVPGFACKAILSIVLVVTSRGTFRPPLSFDVMVTLANAVGGGEEPARRVCQKLHPHAPIV